jgi:hypothetical protein
MFFLMRDWEREMVEPCLLAREIEVALDIEAASFILSLGLNGEEGSRIHFKYSMAFIASPPSAFLTSLGHRLCNSSNPVIRNLFYCSSLIPFPHPLSASPQHLVISLTGLTLPT